MPLEAYQLPNFMHVCQSLILDDAALQRLEATLLRGPTAWGFPTHLWTLRRIVTVIWKVCQVRYSLPQTWRVLRHLG
jgi:Winged helix-turn helix